MAPDHSRVKPTTLSVTPEIRVSNSRRSRPEWDLMQKRGAVPRNDLVGGDRSCQPLRAEDSENPLRFD